METDSQRLKQILKNLLSNSFKFTEKGEIKFRIYKVPKEAVPDHSFLKKADNVIGLEIKDTGIGIPKEKQQIIFEAFQQAEGSTSRKYGGTGLGLSISKGLSELLGGCIGLTSQSGEGSTFTLYLPLKYASSKIDEKMVNILGRYEDASSQPPKSNLEDENNDSDLIGLVHNIINEIEDDRNNIGPKDKVLLVVEDDFRFARIILEKSHEYGIKTIFASRYNEIFSLAHKFKPVAITLDVNLPDTNGWKVLELIKNDIYLRHIPLHVISGKENRSYAFQKGARSSFLKPVSDEDLSRLFKDILNFNNKEKKDLLIIEDNELDSTQMLNSFKGLNINVKVISNGNDVISEINSHAIKKYDCIIADYFLSDLNGKDLLRKINEVKPHFTPVIIHSAKDYTKPELNEIEEYSNTILLKDGRSYDKLIELVAMHLHLKHNELPAGYKEIIEKVRKSEDILKGKNVLIVDDDIRNLFALTSALEKQSMLPHTAENGMEAINIINNNGKIDIVLMDIMMPEMDGYETIKRIRKEYNNQKLPIIAVTAKAMKGDRDKSISAGASDYITKPVNLDNLLSLMRIWLHK